MLQALALLTESVNKEDPAIRIGAIMGLGLAYAGSQNETVLTFFVSNVWGCFTKDDFCSHLLFYFRSETCYLLSSLIPKPPLMSLHLLHSH